MTSCANNFKIGATKEEKTNSYKQSLLNNTELQCMVYHDYDTRLSNKNNRSVHCKYWNCNSELFGTLRRSIEKEMKPQIDIKLSTCKSIKSNSYNNMLKQKKNKDQILRKQQIQEYSKLCKDMGFEEDTEDMRDCLLKQEELRVIKESNEPTVVYEPSKRSNHQFCQSLPGAYTPTWHCW